MGAKIGHGYGITIDIDIRICYSDKYRYGYTIGNRFVYRFTNRNGYG